MSKAEEEEQARLERARAVGLFRYMLIREAADPALSSRQRGVMVREIAAREHAGPSVEPVRVTRWTLDAGPDAGTRRTWTSHHARRLGTI
jgi:putative transposase